MLGERERERKREVRRELESRVNVIGASSLGEYPLSFDQIQCDGLK